MCKKQITPNDCYKYFTELESSIQYLYTSIDNFLFQDIDRSIIQALMPQWVCDGGYTHCECLSRDKKEYVHQDLEDMLINSTPWSETLDMPVLMREKEGWMMFPLATWADVFCDCFSEMTYSHWKETEKIVRSEQEFWEWLREQQK